MKQLCVGIGVLTVGGGWIPVQSVLERVKEVYTNMGRLDAPTNFGIKHASA